MSRMDTIQFALPADLSEAILTYRKERANGGPMMPRAAAIRELIQRGLHSYTPPTTVCSDPACQHADTERPLHVASPCHSKDGEAHD